MEKKLKVGFYLKRTEKKQGKCPIIGRIRICGMVSHFSTGLMVQPGLWDVSSHRARGKSNEATELNAELDEIYTLAHIRYNDLSRRYGYEKIGAQEVKDAIKGIPRIGETLLAVFAEHNEEYERRVEINRVKSTWRNYSNAYGRLARFLKQKYFREDIYFHELDREFIERFARYCKEELHLQPRTVIHTIIPLRKMIRIAIGKGFLDRDPFDGYILEKPPIQQRYLSKVDFDKVISTSYHHPALNLVRDMFAFSSFTGLAYTDLFALTRNNLMEDSECNLWIRTSRKKSKTPVDIPLLPIARQILRKYRHRSAGNKLFPLVSNSTLNDRLKEITAICGLGYNLTFHIARHTFATQHCLSRGVPIDTVSRMLGHQSIDATEIYAEVTTEKIHRDMGAVMDRINESFSPFASLYGNIQ